MLKDISTQAVFTGFIGVLVSFTSTFAVIIAGLTAVGATPVQAASSLMALMLFYGVAGITVGAVSRMPLVIAWSTPGAAILVAAGGAVDRFEVAVGGFIVAGALVVLAGIWRPFRRAVDAIPPALASALLAGVLFGLCLEPVRAVMVSPMAALPVIAVWLIAGRFSNIWAMPAAAAAAFAMIPLLGAPIFTDTILLKPVFARPEFTWSAVGIIALPLFVVTMASQNIPAVSVLRHNGYQVRTGPALALTGIFSIFAAPFGGHSVCLSSLVTALCSGPDAHADPARRYWAAISMGAGAVAFALLAGLIASAAEAAPPHLITAVAGLALLGPLMISLGVALKENDHHESALITFIVSASDFSLFGVGAPFWGLVLGGAVLMFQRAARKYRS